MVLRSIGKNREKSMDEIFRDDTVKYDHNELNRNKGFYRIKNTQNGLVLVSLKQVC